MASDGTTGQQSEVTVSLISDPEDFKPIYRLVSEAFGRQAADAIWTSMQPTWDTPEGQAAGATKLAGQLANTKTNNAGQPNVLFVKGVIGGEIAGFAIWQQLSAVEGFGDQPKKGPDMEAALSLETLYPDDEPMRRWLLQVFKSFYQRRDAVLDEKRAAYEAGKTDKPPAVFYLAMCAVDPKFQRRGVAAEMVKFGI